MREMFPRASLTSAILAALLALVAAPVALAQENSAVDEYTENVPGAGGGSGNTGPSGGGSGGGSGGAGTQAQGGGEELPAAVNEQFQNAGADGAAAAALAQATAPEGTGTDAGGTGGGSPTGGSGSNQAGGGGSGQGSQAGGAQGIDAESLPASGDGGVDDILGVVTGGSADTGGMGVALPLILGAALLAGLLAVLARRRSHGEPDSP